MHEMSWIRSTRSEIYCHALCQGRQHPSEGIQGTSESRNRTRDPGTGAEGQGEGFHFQNSLAAPRAREGRDKHCSESHTLSLAGLRLQSQSNGGRKFQSSNGGGRQGASVDMLLTRYERAQEHHQPHEIREHSLQEAQGALHVWGDGRKSESERWRAEESWMNEGGRRKLDPLLFIAQRCVIHLSMQS